ncbi:MAG: cyd operon YbgE family protein [Pseudomonadota bacterium]
MNLYGGFARAVSLVAAGILALIIMLYPVALSQDGTTPSHGLLTLVMLGISAGFIHGVGFTPRGLAWKWLFHPVLAWLLMAAGFVLLFRG